MDTVQVSIWVVGTLVFVALLFDFMNGFHDAANSIATIVSTRVLKPQQAVVWAAAFNFLAIDISNNVICMNPGLISRISLDHRINKNSLCLL